MDQKDSNFYSPKPNLGDLPISQWSIIYYIKYIKKNKFIK